MESYATEIGLLGVAIVAVAYGLFAARRLTGDDWRYPVLNIVGTLCIFYSLIYQWNLPSVAVQVMWIAISLLGLVRIVRKGKSGG